MLILVRHGQTAANAAGQIQGRIDPPLTELGRRQAEALAKALPAPDAVVTSPLRRARETAAVFGVPSEVDERWTELDYGELDGTPLADVPPGTWERWRQDVSFRPAGGESLSEVATRVRDACDALVERAQDGIVLVVSHVSPIKVAVAWALGAGEEASWRMFLDVASVCRIRVTGGGPLLVSFNERTHLSDIGSG